jgi:hypothetical protein
VELELTGVEKAEILRAGIKQVAARIYDLTVSIEVRKASGYSDEENKPLLVEAERMTKVRDGFKAKLTELA